MQIDTEYTPTYVRANPDIVRGSYAAPTLTVVATAVLFDVASLTQHTVIPLLSIWKQRYFRQSALPRIGSSSSLTNALRSFIRSIAMFCAAANDDIHLHGHAASLKFAVEFLLAAFVVQIEFTIHIYNPDMWIHRLFTGDRRHCKGSRREARVRAGTTYPYLDPRPSTHNPTR